MSKQTADKVGAAVFVIALIVAAVLRLYDLDLKPLHSDEGVNGFFLLRLVTRGYYRYDPTNYHGPFLYYLIAPILFLQKTIGSKATVWGLRILPTLFGIGLVGILWPMRRLFGWAGLAFAAAVIALEPGLVYFSRTTIHEILLLFFTLLTVMGFVLYGVHRTEWHGTANERPGRLSAKFWLKPTVWIVCGVLGLAMCYANKETSIITFGAFFVGGALAFVFGPGGGSLKKRLFRAREIVKEETQYERDKPWTFGWVPCALLILYGVIGAFLVVLGGQVVFAGTTVEDAWAVYAFWTKSTEPQTVNIVRGIAALAVVVIVGAAVFLVPRLARDTRNWWRTVPTVRRRWIVAIAIGGGLLMLLFSSLFNNPRGLWDMFGTHLTWFKRAVATEHTGHEKPFGYYLEIIWDTNAPVIVALLVFAPLAALVRKRWLHLAIGLAAAGAAIWIWETDHESAHLAGIEWSAIPESIRPSFTKLFVKDFGDKVLITGGMIAAVAFARNRFGIFLAGWAGSILMVYSLVDYKTPWLVLNLSLPLMLLTAVYLNDAVGGIGELIKRPAVTMAVATCAVLIAVPLMPAPAGKVLARENAKPGEPARKWVTWAELTYHMNFVAYDDDGYELIYVQTLRDIRPLVERLRRLLESDEDAAADLRMKIQVVSSDYWPIPYYVNDYSGRLGYHSGTIPDDIGDVVIARSTQVGKVGERVEGWRSEQFALRPGVVLILYVKPELWDPIFGPPEEVLEGTEQTPTEGEVKPGLKSQYRYGLRCDGRVLAERVEPKPFVAGRREVREFGSPFCARWSGWLKIDEEREVIFSTVSDDGSWLYIDGKLAVDNGGAHGALRKQSEPITLAPGYHSFQVRYFDSGGGATLRVKWRDTGAETRTEAEIPVSRLFHVPTRELNVP